MLCRTCDAHNDENARFCQACGSSVSGEMTAQARMTGPGCPACGGQNPENARFCVFCATNLLAPPPAYASPQPVQAAYTPALQTGGPTRRLAYAAPAGGQTVNVMTNITYATPQLAQMNASNSVNFLVRAIWFFFIGWWLGGVWTILAWLFNLTLIGLPIGVMMMNATPTVTTLQQRSRRQPVQMPQPGMPQHPLPLRMIWFVLVGWWASLLWSLAAWGLSLTLIMMPISFWMWNRVPTITTLTMEP